MRALLVVAILCGLLRLASLAQDERYVESDRVAYLRDTLEAVRGLGADGRRALEDALYTGARTKCRSQLGRPTMSCLIDLATTTCAGRDGCLLAADVVLVAILSENDLVDEATRIRLVSQSGDYRVGMRAELASVRSTLAAELVLAEPGSDEDLPERIDRFCARRERDPAWQRCAAALIWHIGGEP